MKTTTSLLTAALLTTSLAAAYADGLYDPRGARPAPPSSHEAIHRQMAATQMRVAHDDGSQEGHAMTATEAGGDHRAEMQKMIADMMPAPGDAPSTVDFKKADMAMMHGMHVAYTGNPDIDFRTHMIPHHQGAIAMAKVALKHAKDPTTKAMAQQIITDQEKEIADMQAWLKKNGK